MSDVPRVARSVDDLRVGMVVAWKIGSRGWAVHTLKEQRPNGGFWTTGGAGLTQSCLTVDQVVILSDPPARDWLVPATQMEALREAVDNHDDEPCPVHAAARAVLDAAREVGHE